MIFKKIITKISNKEISMFKICEDIQTRFVQFTDQKKQLKK